MQQQFRPRESKADAGCSAIEQGARRQSPPLRSKVFSPILKGHAGAGYWWVKRFMDACRKTIPWALLNRWRSNSFSEWSVVPMRMLRMNSNIAIVVPLALSACLSGCGGPPAGTPAATGTVGQLTAPQAPQIRQPRAVSFFQPLSRHLPLQ